MTQNSSDTRASRSQLKGMQITAANGLADNDEALSATPTPNSVVGISAVNLTFAPTTMRNIILPVNADNNDRGYRVERDEGLKAALTGAILTDRKEPAKFGDYYDIWLAGVESLKSYGRTSAERLAETIERADIIPETVRKGAARSVRRFASRAFKPSGQYLVDLAQHESGTNDFAAPSTSSARGRYQFLRATWLGVVHAHGKEHGGQLAWAAEHIRRTKDGYVVTDRRYLQQILDMRLDPKYSTPMATAFTADNAATVQRLLGGRQLSNTDLYMAHFLGAGTAARFIREMERNPNAIAANDLSRAARANRWVFYSKTTGARTYREVYEHLGKDFTPSDMRVADAAPSRGRGRTHTRGDEAHPTG
ncbi:MAG: hypothetical protein WAO98_06925 [Alphaproteobacteria bacterium]